MRKVNLSLATVSSWWRRQGSTLKFTILAACSVVAIGAIGLMTVSGTDPDPSRQASGGSQTPSANESPDSRIGSLVFEPVDDGFMRQALGPSQVPDADYGVVLADAKTGMGEFWSVPSTTSETLEYGVDASHHWIWLVDLTEARWIVAVVAGPTADGLVRLNARGTSSFSVVNLRLAPPRTTIEFTIPASRADVSPRALFDVEQLYVAAWDDESRGPGIGSSGLTQLYRVGLQSGEVSLIDGVGASGRDSLRLFSLRDRQGMLVTHLADDEARALIVHRFVDGVLIDESILPGASLDAVPSPDEHWWAWRELTMGIWPTVVVAGAMRGDIVVKAIQVLALDNPPRLIGRSTPGRQAWLSDSSGLLVETAVGFAIVRPEGVLDVLAARANRSAGDRLASSSCAHA